MLPLFHLMTSPYLALASRASVSIGAVRTVAVMAGALLFIHQKYAYDLLVISSIKT